MSSTSLQHNQKTHKNARKSLCAAQIVLRDPMGERQGAIGGGADQPASQRGARLRQNRLWDGITRLLVVNINKYVVRNY